MTVHSRFQAAGGDHRVGTRARGLLREKVNPYSGLEGNKITPVEMDMDHGCAFPFGNRDAERLFAASLAIARPL